LYALIGLSAGPARGGRHLSGVGVGLSTRRRENGTRRSSTPVPLATELLPMMLQELGAATQLSCDTVLLGATCSHQLFLRRRRRDLPL
jgi:hypothetical protein